MSVTACMVCTEIHTILLIKQIHNHFLLQLVLMTDHYLTSLPGTNKQKEHLLSVFCVQPPLQSWLF